MVIGSMSTPQTPYRTLAGVVPCPGGWLIAPARLAGVTLVGEDPVVVSTLVEVLDFKPKFDAAAIHVQIGWFDRPVAPFRPCDADAHRMLGWPRRVAVRPTPSRAALHAPTAQAAVALEPWLTRDDLRRYRWAREAEREFQPFHQRSYAAAMPDLTFLHLNGDVPLRSTPYQQAGVIERIALIRDRLPGLDEIVVRTPPSGAAQVHMLNAVGLLWTARRVAGRAMERLPTEPEWDATGLRMEWVR